MTAQDQPRARWSWGVAIIVVPYLLGFWFTGYTAVQALTGRGSDLGLSGWTALAVAWTCTAVAVAVALALGRKILGFSWSDLGIRGPHDRRVLRGLALSCVAYFLMWVAFFVFGSLPRLGEPALTSAARSHPALWVLVYSLLAGVGEEVLIVAVPVAVMTVLRWPWAVQILVLVVLRTPFHLYYGYTAIVLAVIWSVLYWLLYSRYRWIWPLVAAHTLYDCVVSSSAFGATGSLVLRLGAVVVLLVGAGLVVRQILRDRRGALAPAAGVAR
ncbi:MAG: CPBP family intramembrane glutamic endopeptidase [Janthinobacterium lividum]